MKKNYVFFTILWCVSFSSLNASYTLIDGKFIRSDSIATFSVQEHHTLEMEALQNENWEELVRQSFIIVSNFPSTPFGQESLFYLGMAHFHLKDFDLANQYFSKYLHRQTTPKHFEETIQYKYQIAEQFRQGAKKHVMGLGVMPKWVPAQEEALSIYEEVVSALPNDELAARAIFGKAQILFTQELFKESVESYQTLIRRFPKNSLAIESYLRIGEVYLKQCQAEYPDRDLLDLAEINLRKFHIDFPKEEKYAEAEKLFVNMQEIYAASLFETGQFFERTKKFQASLLYYNKIVTQFPNTKVATRCHERMKILSKKKIKAIIPAIPESSENLSEVTKNPKERVS